MLCLSGFYSITYTKKIGSKEGLSFTYNGHIDFFRAVYVDGKQVDSKYYTVRSGSTVVTFSKEFMSELEKGEHQIQFKFSDSYSTVGVFTVANSWDKPRTADGGDTGLWFGLLLMSSAAMAATLPRLKRKEK